MDHVRIGRVVGDRAIVPRAARSTPAPSSSGCTYEVIIDRQLVVVRPVMVLNVEVDAGNLDEREVVFFSHVEDSVFARRVAKLS